MTRIPGPEESSAAKSRFRNELYHMLLRDHERIRDLVGRIEKTDSNQVDARKELFIQLEQELLSHMEAEERFFYTALEPNEKARPRVLEGFEEHQVTRTVIGAFNSLAVDDERWPAKLRVLGRLVRHHMDQEERELFRMGEEMLSAQQFQGMAAKVRELMREPKKG